MNCKYSIKQVLKNIKLILSKIGGKMQLAESYRVCFLWSLVYEAQKKIDLPYEIYRTRFHPSSTCRERNIPTQGKS